MNKKWFCESHKCTATQAECGKEKDSECEVKNDCVYFVTPIQTSQPPVQNKVKSQSKPSQTQTHAHTHLGKCNRIDMLYFIFVKMSISEKFLHAV